MDHLDGIEDFFAAFTPANMWDTDNREVNDFSESIGRYKEADWLFYKSLRDGGPNRNPRRLTLYSGSLGAYYNQGDGETSGGDGIHILAPTEHLIANANECGDYNDCSYVLLYRANGHRIVFGGDSHDRSWEHILDEHGAA